MKQKFETEVMEQLKKGFQPVYYGEEGFIAISMKAYLTAAEYADAERYHFWYGDVRFDLIDLDNRSEEIEAEDFDFMPRKVAFDSSDEEAELDSDKEVEGCNFKVGDIIRPTPEADNHYLHTGSDLIEAEVIEIKSRDLIEIEVREHVNNEFIGESFYVDPAYFELAEGDKTISADDIFQLVEDIEAAYVVIADKCTALATPLYNLYCGRLLDPKDGAVRDRIQAIISERERYEKILCRLADYMEVRKNDQRVMSDDGRENKTD